MTKLEKIVEISRRERLGFDGLARLVVESCAGLLDERARDSELAAQRITIKDARHAEPRNIQNRYRARAEEARAAAAELRALRTERVR